MPDWLKELIPILLAMREGIPNRTPPIVGPTQQDASGYPTRKFPKGSPANNTFQNVAQGLDPTFGALASMFFGDPEKPNVPLQMAAGVGSMFVSPGSWGAKGLRLAADDVDTMYKLLATLDDDELEAVTKGVANRGEWLDGQRHLNYESLSEGNRLADQGNWAGGMEGMMQMIADRAVQRESLVRSAKFWEKNDPNTYTSMMDEAKYIDEYIRSLMDHINTKMR